jgi:hypothetical protein
VSEETNAQTARRLATGQNTVDKAKIFAMLAIADAIRDSNRPITGTFDVLGGGTDAGRAR